MPYHKESLLRKVVAAYVSYSYLSQETHVKMVEHSQFRLKITNDIVDISTCLIDLFYKDRSDKVNQTMPGRVTEEDCFWVLLSISLTFMPEHF